jgi:arsenite-transporting ATPase
MSDIEVEAVDSIDASMEAPAGVEAPEYVLYGGKGGVGKTTCAAATALASANDGTQTLVVSTDPAHSLSDVLETPIPAEPARLSEDVPLYGVEIDPDAVETPFSGGGMDDLFGGMAGASAAGAGAGPGAGADVGGDAGPAPGDGGMPNPFDPGAMPGADEAAAMQLLLEYLDDPRFERVIVDTAPTGHTLRLLQLPELMESMVGRLLTFRERMSGMLGNLPGPFGDESAGEGIDQLEELSERIERLRGALRDPARTEFRVVMVPERLSVIEAERLLRRLEEFGIPTGTVVVNRVTEDLANVTDAEADWFVKPDPENCRFCARRWESQQEALSRAQEVFRGRTIERVPLFAEEVRGPDMLRVVAACLT